MQAEGGAGSVRGARWGHGLGCMRRCPAEPRAPSSFLSRWRPGCSPCKQRCRDSLHPRARAPLTRWIASQGPQRFAVLFALCCAHSAPRRARSCPVVTSALMRRVARGEEVPELPATKVGTKQRPRLYLAGTGSPRGSVGGLGAGTALSRLHVRGERSRHSCWRRTGFRGGQRGLRGSRAAKLPGLRPPRGSAAGGTRVLCNCSAPVGSGEPEGPPG